MNETARPITTTRPVAATDLSQSVIVVPDELREADAVRRLQEAVSAAGGTAIDVLAQRDFSADLFGSAHVIACGNMADNAAVCDLYIRRRCFADRFFPGPNGYFIKSISDPFGHGFNAIGVGASTSADVLAALPILEDLVRGSDSSLGRVHAHHLPAHDPLPPLPTDDDLDELVRTELAIWGGGWSASPFRGGRLRDYLWHFYLTDCEVWGRAVAAVFAGSFEPWRADRLASPDSYHCFFHLDQFIHLWDLVEDSAPYTDDERRCVASFFAELLRHVAGLFYLREDVNPPDMPRQNHVTFIALNLTVGHEYLQRCYQVDEFAPAAAASERIFASQARSYKPNDDAAVGYVWHVPLHTLHHMLAHGDFDYIDEGHVAALCDLAVVTTDNMRSECGYGDTGGYSTGGSGLDMRLWPFLVSSWRRPDPRTLWLLNWLGAGVQPGLSHCIDGLFAAVEFDDDGITLNGCQPQLPDDLLGIVALPLPELALDWVRAHTPAAHRPRAGGRYFDKLSLRPGFGVRDEYLLLEGSGTFCHGHEDANAIIRLTWNERAWLADGDYIRAAPRFHNSLLVQRDGVGTLEPPGDGVVVPPLARLEVLIDGTDCGLVQSVVDGYNGVDWRRSLVWRKGRFITVVDRLVCRHAGSYSVRRLWRLIGEVSVDEMEGVSVVRQEGESLYIHHADRAERQIVADKHPGGLWTAYPHADGVPQVLHETLEAELVPGDSLVLASLFTPWDQITVGCGEEEGPYVVRDGDEIVAFGDGAGARAASAGGLEVGDLRVDSVLFAALLSQSLSSTVTVHGVGQIKDEAGRRLSLDGDGGGVTATDLDGDWEGQLRTALTSLAAAAPSKKSSPTTSDLRPARTSGSSSSGSAPDPSPQPIWSRDLRVPPAAVHVRGSRVLIGLEKASFSSSSSSRGEVQLLSTTDGETAWRRELESPPTAVLLAGASADEMETRALVGTAASDLLSLHTGDGDLAWQRPLENLNRTPAPVTALAAADLAGDGQQAVLAATAGWYVNAFDADGDSLWANWIRYHVITALAVEDVDGDGRAEVIVGTVYSTPLTVHDWDGSFRWTTLEQVGSEANGTTPRRGIGLSRLLVVDVDGDGTGEIVYGTDDGWLFAVRPHDGQEVWHAHLVGGITGLVNVEEEGSSVVATTEFGDVFFFDGKGELLRRVRAARWIRTAVAGGNGLIVAAADGGRLLGLNAGGTCSWALDCGEEINEIWTADNGFVVGLESGKLLCFESP